MVSYQTVETADHVGKYNLQAPTTLLENPMLCLGSTTISSY